MSNMYYLNDGFWYPRAANEEPFLQSHVPGDQSCDS